MTPQQVDELILLHDEGYTWKELTKFFKKHTPNALRKAYYRNIRKPGLRVLVFDIETAPMLGYVWGLFDQNIGLDQLKEDWSVLSFSAKWLGSSEKEVMYKDNRDAKDPRDDRELLKVIHSLLNEADVVLVQNGVRFDVPKLNARFVLNGMKPTTSYRVIDTFRIAKRHFGFTSNKLAYMTDKLCTKYKKQEHSEFAGFKMWKECLAGNLKAWKSMEQYNKYDVLSLEELYYKLAPWDKTINFNVYYTDMKDRCSCGNDKFEPKGFVYTNTGKFQRHVCSSCGKEYRDNENLLSKEKRKAMRK